MKTLCAAVTLVLALTLWSPPGAVAQLVQQPTPSPVVTAESESWYLSGQPLTYAGMLFYPAGPQVFFNANEMVRSGFYMGVPLYSRTTLEPFSVVFVPVGRGLMQPYEPRRSATVPETPQAQGPPTSVGTVSPPVADSRPVISTGMRTRIGPPPRGLNAVFIEFAGRRWYRAGEPVPLDTGRMRNVGDLSGFPVYSDDNGVARIFVPITRNADRLLPYTPHR